MTGSAAKAADGLPVPGNRASAAPVTPDVHAQLAALPSMERLLSDGTGLALERRHGRAMLLEALRDAVTAERRTIQAGRGETDPRARILERAGQWLAERDASGPLPVLNLTGTVLHTNLGRSPLPEVAIAAVAAAARGATDLEYDLATGRRGDRDKHLQPLICRLTGAEAATVVNNNAAAVLLVLNTLALRREVIVSRGELVEIGGAFRIPDVMARAGARLSEVGTTNRTHAADYRTAITPRAAALMKVHTSNYKVVGFTAGVSVRDVAAIAHAHRLPLIVDLGSGSLVDLARFGLPHEPTAAEAIAAGADVVTFSGDKLLGGPQAGLIVGRRELISRIKRNPLWRALRCDKMTIAALAAVLRLHLDPGRLASELPAVRLLRRSKAEIEAAARELAPAFQKALGPIVRVEVIDCHSQIGSGAMPVESLASAGLRLTPKGRKNGARLTASGLAELLRGLPVPVIGRVQSSSVILDLRCLEDKSELAAQLPALGQAARSALRPAGAS